MLLAKLQLWLAIAWPPMGLEEKLAGLMSNALVSEMPFATRLLGARESLDYRPFNLVFGLVDVDRLHDPGHSCRQQCRNATNKTTNDATHKPPAPYQINPRTFSEIEKCIALRIGIKIDRAQNTISGASTPKCGHMSKSLPPLQFPLAQRSKVPRNCQTPKAT